MKRRRSSPQSISDAEYRRMPKYSIGVVSKLLGIPPQTLRRYEEAGLLDPARQDGKNRLYSDENLETLTEIVELSEQGVNAIGIRYILQMRQEVYMLRRKVTEVQVRKEASKQEYTASEGSEKE